LSIDFDEDTRHVPVMAVNIDWILEALKRDTTKSRAGTARALNVDRSAITRLLHYDLQLKFHEAKKIGIYLGVTPVFNNNIALTDRNHDNDTQTILETAPIYEAGILATGVWMVHRLDPAIDHKLRAPHFMNAARVFGFYAPDNTMAPRFKSGEIIWIDPARAPEINGDVLLVDHNVGPDGSSVMLAELIEKSLEEWIIIQHAAPQEHRLERTLWDGLYVLPRY